MDDILAKKNRHLFLEEKDNQNNSFIGNINDVANRKTELDTVAAHIENVDTVGDHIDNVDTVANNISDINDAVDNIATVKTFNDNVNNGTMQYLLEAFTTSLNEQGNAWEVRLTQLGESILATTSAFNYSTVVTVSSDIPANGTLILPNSMKYKVGTHMLMVSWNGTVCYAGDQYDEVGAYGVWATSIKLNQPAKTGDKIQLRIVALTDQSSYVDITEAAINVSQFVASGSNTERYLPEFLGDVVNVKNFGAVGNGVNDDTTAFQSAIASGKAIFVPDGVYKVATETTKPDFLVFGDGELSIDNIRAGGCIVEFNPERESLYCTPKMHLRDTSEITYPLPRESGYTNRTYNTVYASGSGLKNGGTEIKYCTAFGYGCGSAPIAWQYTDAIGGDAMIYAGYSDRNVAVGCETFCWGGAPSKEWLITYNHDYWRHPGEHPYVPGETGWDVDSLETKFPGVGQRLADFTDYAASPEDFSNNTAVGRDAGVHIVKGYGNVMLGYGAAADLFSGNRNTAVGQLAFHDAVFAELCTAIGCNAGKSNCDGEGNVFVGYKAGTNAVGGAGGVFIGYRAAEAATSATEAIVIGHNAGKNETNLDNSIWIGNWTSAAAFAADTNGEIKIGCNIAPADIRGKCHFKCGSSGNSSNEYSGLFLVEANSTGGIVIESTSSGYPRLIFSSPDSNLTGGIVFANASKNMSFMSGSTTVFRITSYNVEPGQDNTFSLGKAATRWSEVFSATGAINTSDLRQKENVSDPQESLFRAWSKVGFKAFQFKEAVFKKGKTARIHLGVVAQDVEKAFNSEGLDASQYGLFCYDKWDDKYEDVEVIDKEAVFDSEGNEISPAVTHTEHKKIQEAGDSYGIRYEEALALECAYQRWLGEQRDAKIEALMQRISALENNH